MVEVIVWLYYGASVGSFAALIASRYRSDLRADINFRRFISPGSHCHHCLRPLSFTDMLPILSWVYRQGRCRYCQASVGLSSLMTEFAGAIMFLPLAVLPAPGLKLAMSGFCTFLLILAAIDQRHLLLPDWLTQPLLWLGLLCHCYFWPANLSDALAGVLAGYLSLRLLALAYFLLRQTEGLGRGDVKLFAALGGWCGWQYLPVTLLIASALALLFAVLTCRPARSRLAFGPFLVIAGWAVAFIRLTTAGFAGIPVVAMLYVT